MATVSNTSPLLNLGLIGKLELVQQQFDRVLIPPAVEEEFRLEEEQPGTAALRRALQEGWVDVKEPNDDPLIRTLCQDIDEGEAESIALAVEVDANRVLIDEREGRRRARRVGLDVTGVLGILSRAHKTGTLRSLSNALDQLENEAGFWIDSSLREHVLEESGEE